MADGGLTGSGSRLWSAVRARCRTNRSPSSAPDRVESPLAVGQGEIPIRPVSRETLNTRIGETVVFQRFVFALGTEAHPEEWARQALERGVAIAAVDSFGDLMVSSRVDHAVRDLRLLNQFFKQVEARGWFGLVQFASRHPRYSWNLFRIWRRRRRAAPERLEQLESAEPSEFDIEETLERIRQEFVEGAILEGIAANLDSLHVKPGYLEDQPWCRLTLPGIDWTDTGGNEVGFEVSALVHRSGVVVVSFARLLEDPLPVEVSLAASSRPDVVASFSIDERVLELAAEAQSATVDYSAVTRLPRDGRPAVRVDVEDPLSVADLFGMYRDAISQSLNRGKLNWVHPDYLMIPLVSLRAAPERLHEELGPHLAMLRGDDLGDDYSLRHVLGVSGTPNASIYLSSGAVVHAFRDQYRQELSKHFEALEDVPGQEWSFYETAVGTAVEVALCRLAMLDRDGRSLRHASTSRDLRDAMRQIMSHFSDVTGGRLLMAGELHHLEQEFLALHGFRERSGLLLEQVGLAARVIESRDAERLDRASVRVQAAVLLLTVLLAVVTPIGALLAWEQADETVPEVFGEPFTTWGPWVLLAVAGGSLCILALWSLMRLGRAALQPFRRPDAVVRLPVPSKFPPRLEGTRLDFVDADDGESR